MITRPLFIRATRALLLCSLLVLGYQTPVTAQAIFGGSGEITTAGADCAVATNCVGFFADGIASFGIHLDVGTSGTFHFEVSQDATSNTTGTWTAWPEAVGGNTSATADGAYYFGNPGFRRFRVRASAISGAATLSAARGYVPLRSTATLTGADGALLDGANSEIRATVLDYVNSNPLAVRLTDSNGDYSAGGGAGGAAQANNTALSDITGMGGLYDTTPPLCTDGNVCIPRISPGQYLFVEFPSAQPVTQSGTWTVTGAGGTFPATQSGTWNLTNISGTISLPTGAASAANQTTQLTNTGSSADAAATVGAGASLAAHARLASTQRDNAQQSLDSIDQSLNNIEASPPLIEVQCDDTTTVAIAEGNSGPARGDCTSRALFITGDVAHDSPDAGRPIKIGGVARTADPTAVTPLDRVSAYYSKLGKQVVEPIAIRERRTPSIVSLSSTTETQLIAAGAAGEFRDLVHISCYNESASQVRIDVRDSTGGTVRFKLVAAAGMPAGSNFTIPWPQTTAANNWTVQLSSAVSSVHCHAMAAGDR